MRATLSNASPTASSSVLPTTSYLNQSFISTSSVCPPDIKSPNTGSLTSSNIILSFCKMFECSFWARDEIKWPSMWLVARSGTLRSAASFLANSMPVHSAGSSPGPCVTATAPYWSSLNCSNSAGKFLRCSRLARLGYTPPYGECSRAWLSSAAFFVSNIKPSGVLAPSTKAIPVSSQEVSMARIFILGFFMLYSRLLVHARLAQLVERHIDVVDVVGSTPTPRTSVFDQVLRGAGLEGFYVGDRRVEDAPDRLGGIKGDMRGHNHAGMSRQVTVIERLCKHRLVSLLLQYIKPRTREHLRFERLHQCGCLDQRAARGVDEVCAFFDLFDRLRVYKMMRLFGIRRVQGDDIGCGKKRGERYVLEPYFFSERRVLVDVVHQYRHAEPFGDAGHVRADAPGADDAYGFAL